MPAYQIQVQGRLDGATPFVLPSPVPQPANGGVIKIVAGSAGSFDLNTLALTDGTPVWLRALHVEFAAATRAARFTADISGSNTRDRIIPDQASVATVLMRPYVLAPAIIQPIGTVLDILTDDTDDTFTGTPVQGPHFVYLDVEPITSDAQMGLIQDLASFARAKSEAEGEIFVSSQAVAASGTEELGVVNVPNTATWPKAQIASAVVTVGAAPAAGESMVIDIERVAVTTGAVTTIGTVTLSNPGTTSNSITVIPIDPVTNTGFNNGDRIRVTRTYVAGGAPTPMADTVVRIQLAPVAFT